MNIKTLLVAIIFFSIYRGNCQHNYDDQSIIYSNNGFVGIGTQSPETALHFQSNIDTGNRIYDGIAFTKASGGNYSIQLTSINGAPHIDFSNSANQDYDLRIIVPESDRMVVSGGYLGVSLIPHHRFHVNGSSATTNSFLFRNADNSGTAGLKGANSNTIIKLSGDGLISQNDNIQTIGSQTNRFKDLWLGNNAYVDGFVGIGTSNPDEKLTVNGKIHSKEVRIDLSVPAPDYVFEKEYSLKTLDELENYIIKNKHLPEIPSAHDFEREGISVGEMNMLLLKKVEELTLYIIQQDKENQLQSEILSLQSKEINKFQFNLKNFKSELDNQKLEVNN